MPQAGLKHSRIANWARRVQFILMVLTSLRALAVALLLACASAATSAPLPAEILRQLPLGYQVISSANSSVRPARKFYFVALASRTVAKLVGTEARAPARPLLIFEARKSGRYALVARNDDVILKADGGGMNGCDPFGDRDIAVKGNYVTVEQGVACGAHWTDYVTFRFDPRSAGYIFDNWRTQSSSLNPSNNPKAQALISNGQTVVRATARPVPFAQWRRPSGG